MLLTKHVQLSFFVIETVHVVGPNADEKQLTNLSYLMIISFHFLPLQRLNCGCIYLLCKPPMDSLDHLIWLTFRTWPTPLWVPPDEVLRYCKACAFCVVQVQ